MKTFGFSALKLLFLLTFFLLSRPLFSQETRSENANAEEDYIKIEDSRNPEAEGNVGQQSWYLVPRENSYQTSQPFADLTPPLPQGSKVNTERWRENLQKDDKEVLVKLKTLYIAEINRDIDIQNEARIAVLSSHVMTILIFLVVHLILGVSVRFSYLELKAASKLRNKGKSNNPEEISISMESLAIKTTSRAMLFLIISLLLYLAFVIFIYPIKVV